MAYDITDPAAVHRLQLEGREKLTVAGVEDVERFDDQCIVLRTGAAVEIPASTVPTFKAGKALKDAVAK